RLHGMRPAVERLRRACAQREKILVYGDYDVDGTTSVVLLRKALEMTGGSAEFHIPHRLKDGYGMREEVIERAAAEGVRVVVSVDTGIRETAVVERANQLGIDTIITDHHLPDAATPPALAVLNPNQPGCQYPEKNLCGAGVVFKLCQALLASLDWPAARLNKVIESMLRMVAIATVADVVPLLGENRTIVKLGLDGLRRPVNPGLKALLASAGFSPTRPPTAGGVAFWVAPRLNAAGRMDTANDVIELFTVSDPQRAAEIAAKLNELNTDRQQAETRILDEVLETLADGPGKVASIVAVGEGWHRGVLGIVASRLVERFHRPVMVLSVDPEEGLASGSGRSIRAFHLLEALDSMHELFVRYGGHRQAAGCTLPADRVEEFRRRFEDYARARLTADDFIPEIRVDADLPLAQITDENMRWLDRAEPYGFGNPEPVFAATGLKLSSQPRVLKEKHLRLALRQQGSSIAAMGWNMGHRAASLEPGALLDAAFTVEPDDYAGGWRIVLRDLVTR
ncbi:MAG: single-stranded-DNA-specific exonuclease RecJ, partial [Acidobacteria bacterium]|nr:single-stranded-DNA-specific exonuclease RecJ [Acidobacteriota bacterium]